MEQNEQIEKFAQLSKNRNEQLAAQVAELQEQIKKGAHQEVEELRAVLEAAKSKLMEQDELLQRLTAAPLVLAVVLRVDSTPLPPKYEVGAKVRVLSGAPHSSHEGQIGEITGEDHQHGQIHIGFSDGDTEVHFANVLPMGLRIPGKPEAKRDDFTVGTLVEITGTDYDGRNRNIGKIGKIDRINNDNNSDPWRRVDLPGDDRAWYWVGVEPYIQPIDHFAGTAVVLHEGKQLEVALPTGKEVKAGDTVKLSMETLQIVDVAQPVYAGGISIVRRAIDEKTSEVEIDGSVRVVLNGTLQEKPETGDRVVLDATATVIGLNLGKEDERFSFTAETNVTWDDIGGLADAKQQMIEAIELPFRYPDIYKHYGKKPIKGVLLYGPPGCGKTMLGKAAATALAKLHNGKSVSSGFIYVKGPEILDRFVGVAEATIRQIFQRSRKHKEQHGYPSVIFIDEADAILGKRGMGISSDIERTIVPQFLAEMDGLEETGAVVLLATNRADILDPAVTRDGRVDRKVKIVRPDLNSARDIFGLYLKQVPLYNGYSREKLADVAALELFSEKRVLYSIQLDGDRKDKPLSFTLGNLVSGAMVAGIVDQATSIALHRDIKNGKPQGMSKDDLVQAVECTFQQNFDLNHNDELADFIHDFREDVTGVRKLRQGAGAAVN